MGNQTLMWLQQRFQSHCLWIIPEANLSHAILESGLRQQKDRKAERLIQVREGDILVMFSQKQKMHLPNHKPVVPITLPEFCNSLEMGNNFKWGRTPLCYH